MNPEAPVFAALSNDNSNYNDNEISKYKDLENEMQKMWHLKATVIPVVVGTLGTTKNE